MSNPRNAREDGATRYSRDEQAVAGALAGAEFDILARLGGFPRLPINEGEVTTGGIIAIVVAVVAALAGAILGGLAGMRYHRKVDKAGLEV
jgi:outer membrane lipoprotein SlyB